MMLASLVNTSNSIEWAMSEMINEPREAFRLHPIAPFNLPHVSSVNTTVAGYFIPKGSHVLLSRSGLGRNPEVWDDPLTFNSDRHTRGCPRVLLGTTMTVMLMATLVHGFKWELPPSESHIDLDENLHNLGKAKPLMAIDKSSKHP
nr:valine N-monooxygenase 1-like [Tanacetum cinerariifolium]